VTLRCRAKDPAWYPVEAGELGGDKELEHEGKADKAKDDFSQRECALLRQMSP
jgi:hypothetical protein